jgi:hypothetical protein
MGCAFDVVTVRQVPAVFSSRGAGSSSFILTASVTVPLGTGFPTELKTGTRWQQTGVLEQGLVYFTDDQIVVVEASNIYEARLVINDRRLIGFYLPVERSYVPLAQPITLAIDIQK